MNIHRTIIICCALLLASCSELQPRETAPMEISFSLAPETKGVVTGNSLFDDGEASWRDLMVTAYLKPASGQIFSERPYFTAETFSRNGDSKWSHNPAIYWPVGGTLDILAVSTTEPLEQADVQWFRGNIASGVRIAVDRHHTQDDIMYGALWESGSESASTSLPMKHTQAYIEVRCHAASGTTATLDSVILNSVFLEGDLEIINNVGAPDITWNFRRFRAYNVLVDDLAGVYGTTLTSTPVSVSMLVPEQDKTSIRVIYHIGGVRKEQTVTLAHERWLAGGRYVYEITIRQS